MDKGAHPVALLDVGKTTVRVELRGGPSTVRLRQPVRGWLGSDAGRQALLGQLAALAATPVAAGAPVAVGAAIAGFDGAPPGTRAELTRALKDGFASATRVVAVSDVRAAHAGALGGGPGVVLLAGTGAMAFGIDAERQTYRADGRGPELGDEGSGGWIGRQGCLAAMRAHERRGPDTALHDACEARFGLAFDRLSRLFAEAANPAGEFGRFAPDVLQAWRAGDAAATEIVERAVAHLVASAASVLRRMPRQQRRVCLVGGLSEAADFAAAVAAGIAASEPDSELGPPEGDALDGMALLLDATSSR